MLGREENVGASDDRITKIRVLHSLEGREGIMLMAGILRDRERRVR